MLRLPTPCVQIGDDVRSKGRLWVLRQEDVDKVRQHRFRRSCFPGGGQFRKFNRIIE